MCRATSSGRWWRSLTDPRAQRASARRPLHRSDRRLHGGASPRAPARCPAHRRPAGGLARPVARHPAPVRRRAVRHPAAIRRTSPASPSAQPGRGPTVVLVTDQWLSPISKVARHVQRRRPAPSRCRSNSSVRIWAPGPDAHRRGAAAPAVANRLSAAPTGRQRSRRSRYRSGAKRERYCSPVDAGGSANWVARKLEHGRHEAGKRRRGTPRKRAACRRSPGEQHLARPSAPRRLPAVFVLLEQAEFQATSRLATVVEVLARCSVEHQQGHLLGRAWRVRSALKAWTRAADDPSLPCFRASRRRDHHRRTGSATQHQQPGPRSSRSPTRSRAEPR